MSDPQRPTVTPPEGVIAPAVQLIVDCQDVVVYRQAQRFLVRTLAWISIAFGVALLLGGRARFESTPTFTYASAMPGGHVTWGAAAFLAGAWSFASSFRWHRRGIMWGLLTQAVLFSFFTVTIAVSAVEDRTTPYTGIVIYGGYSVICTVAYVVGHELRKERADAAP